MKILVVCQYYYPEPFRITDICESLVKRGHDVTVLTGLPNYPEGVVLEAYRHGKKRKEVLNGVKVKRCSEIGRGKRKINLFLNYLSYSISATISALLMQEKFDVVFVNQLSPILMAIPAVAYKMKFKSKVMLYCLDLWPASLVAGGIAQDSIIFKMFYAISRWIYQSADSILVTSSMFNDYFSDVLKINETEIIHLPQYAEDLFEQTSNPRYSRNEQKETYNFVFAGNIGDVQSVDTIIKAANVLEADGNAFFHILGDGSKLGECKRLAEKMNLNTIKFYGRLPVNDMPQFYDMADAMLITLKDDNSLSYTLPGKIQSYMAAGKPIIGAINGETRIVINDAVCGLTCEAEDYIALAQLIRAFMISDEKELMGVNALIYYKTHYEKDIFMNKLENALFHLEASNVQK